MHFAFLRQVAHIETGFWQINLSGAAHIRWEQFICRTAKGRRTGCTSMESMTGMYKGAGARFISKQHYKPERVQHLYNYIGSLGVVHSVTLLSFI